MFSYADLMPLPGIYSTITIKYLQKKSHTICMAVTAEICFLEPDSVVPASINRG